MNVISVHRDFFDVIRDHSIEEIGALFLALAADVEGSEAPELCASLSVIRKLVNQQNKRFSEKQSQNGNKGGAPKKNQNANKQPKQAGQPNPSMSEGGQFDDEEQPKQPKQPKQPSVSVSVTEAVTKKEKEKPPLPPPETKPEKRRYAEFVRMTNDEYSSLIAKLGERGAVRCVEILDNYKGSTGKKYTSDYRAILSWVISRYEQDQQKAKLGGVNYSVVTEAERQEIIAKHTDERGLRNDKAILRDTRALEQSRGAVF